MRYTLLSHGRVVGYTDLDIRTTSLNMRQGFIEPCATGYAMLRDATGVVRVTNAEHQPSRGARRSQREREAYLERFWAACRRREALNLELRDDNGELFECDFMRVYDLREMEQTRPALDVDEFERAEYLESLTPEERATEEALRESDAAMLEESLAEWMAEHKDEEMYHSAWPPPAEPDPRWETMRYHLQVFLKGAEEWDEDQSEFDAWR